MEGKVGRVKESVQCTNPNHPKSCRVRISDRWEFDTVYGLGLRPEIHEIVSSTAPDKSDSSA